MHGLALNVSRKALRGFKQIIPCGISGIEPISIETIKGTEPDILELSDRLETIFLRRFYADFNLAVAVHKELSYGSRYGVCAE